jgi:hypothetical protein
VAADAALQQQKDYFFDSATDTARNSFKSFESSNAALRARVPAALLFFSTCNAAFVANASYWAAMFSTKVFISIKFLRFFVLQSYKLFLFCK